MLKVTISYMKHPGMLQPEHHEPLQVPTVAAQLKEEKMSRNTFSSENSSLMFSPQ